MTHQPSISGPRYWSAIVKQALAESQRVERRRRADIKEVVDICVAVVEAGGALHYNLIDTARALMEIMSRAEQIEMLCGILRRVDMRDRDEALALITALLPYAKRRANAPRSEIAGVSMLDAIIRKCKAPTRRRGH